MTDISKITLSEDGRQALRELFIRSFGSGTQK